MGRTRTEIVHHPEYRSLQYTVWHKGSVVKFCETWEDAEFALRNAKAGGSK